MGSSYFFAKGKISKKIPDTRHFKGFLGFRNLSSGFRYPTKVFKYNAGTFVGFLLPNKARILTQKA